MFAGLGLALLLGTAPTGCGSDGNGGAAGTGGGTAGTGGGTGGGAAGTSAGGSGGSVACGNDMTPVSTDITSDTTWACNSYVMQRKIHITNNATLTIAAGSTIYGDGSADNPAALISTRDGKLRAIGTPTAPITFTSYVAPGSRAPGDTFAGVVLLGKATINSGSCQMDGDSSTPACDAPGYLETSIEGIDPTDLKGKYGGSDDTHDCGELRYVRIQFGGFVIGANNELNGLTVGACGTNTRLSYIQVHRGLDDGIEFFGGTTGADHVVVSGVDDDSIDWDFGWRGRIQFLIVHQAYGKGDKGFESDNNPTTNNATPWSKPEIWNATLIGESNGKIGMHLKNGTRGVFRNFIVQGFSGGAVDVDAKVLNPANEWPAELSIENSLFHNGPLSRTETSTAPDGGTPTDNDMGFDEAAAIMTAARMNTTDVDPMLGSTAIASPNYVPGNTSGVSGKGTPSAGFDATATYAGAVAPGTDPASAWYAGWTEFPEN